MADNDILEKKLIEISNRYIAQLPLRMAEIEVAWQACQHNQVKPEDILALDDLIHTLAGSAGTFDMPTVTDVARAINFEIKNTWLVSNKKITESEISKLQALLTQLHECSSDVEQKSGA